MWYAAWSNRKGSSVLKTRVSDAKFKMKETSEWGLLRKALNFYLFRDFTHAGLMRLFQPWLRCALSSNTESNLIPQCSIFLGRGMSLSIMYGFE